MGSLSELVGLQYRLLTALDGILYVSHPCTFAYMSSHSILAWGKTWSGVSVIPLNPI